MIKLMALGNILGPMGNTTKGPMNIMFKREKGFIIGRMGSITKGKSIETREMGKESYISQTGLLSKVNW